MLQDVFVKKKLQKNDKMTVIYVKKRQNDSTLYYRD